MSHPKEKFNLQFGPDRSVSLDQRHLPYLLVGGGLLVLLIGQIGVFNFWPLFVLIPGVSLIYASKHKEGTEAIEMYKGGVITTATGMILMFQAATGNWASWSYIWAVYPFLGAGYLEYYEGMIRGKERKVAEGKTQMKIWAGVLAASALVFEVFIFQSLSPVLLGLALLAGGFLLMRRQRGDEVDFDVLTKPKNDDPIIRKAKNKNDEDDDTVYDV